MRDPFRKRPFRELLALFFFVVDLIATIAFIVVLVFVFIWLGTFAIEWLVDFFRA